MALADSWSASSFASLAISPPPSAPAAINRTNSQPTVQPDTHAPAATTSHALPRAARTLSLTLGAGVAAAASLPGLYRILSQREDFYQRDLLLTVKGTRHRRRWANDRLVGVPFANEPPLPIDRHAQPTHPVVDVHYHLAHFWDRGLRQQADEEAARRLSARKAIDRAMGCATGAGPGEAPRALREVLKRSPAVWAWAHAVEEQLRAVAAAAVATAGLGDWEEVLVDDLPDEIEDDETILVSRRRRASTQLQARALRGSDASVSTGIVPVGMLGVAFDNLGDDKGSAFKRWLIHCVANYYRLESQTATSSKAEKTVYVRAGVGVYEGAYKQLPRSLTEVCGARC